MSELPLEEQDFSVQESFWKLLASHVISGDVEVLLGAGASKGCTTLSGARVLDAAELKSQLIKKFTSDSLPLDEDADLKDIFQLLLSVESANKQAHRFIKHHYTNCVASWHGALCELGFKRVWTLNLDDTVESAFRKSKKKYDTITFSDQFKDIDSSGEVTQIVHLHGFAGSVDEFPHYVLSTSQYASANRHQKSWHTTFRDIYQQKTFIVIGTSMSAEFDLDHMISQVSLCARNTGLPAILVNPQLSKMKEKMFRDLRMVILPMTAEQFFAKLETYLPEARAERGVSVPEALRKSGEPEAIERFLAQWRPFVEDPSPPSKEHDFYDGDEPELWNIANDYDVRFLSTEKILEDIENFFVPGTSMPRFHAISGPPGCGKSTALLRLGWDLKKRGWNVFLFANRQRLDAEVLQRVAQGTGKLALLIDGGSDQSREFGFFVKFCAENQLPVCFVATERESRVDELLKDIPRQYCAQRDYPYAMATLAARDIDRLILKYRSAGRLGDLEAFSDAEVKMQFSKRADRQLLVGLLMMKNGKLRDKLTSEYFGIKDLKLQKLYYLSCLVYQAGYAIPLSVGLDAAGVTSNDATNALAQGGPLFGILRLREGGLVPRHRFIASEVADDKKTEPDIYNTMLSLAEALSKRMELSDVYNRTIEARVARYLFNHKFVVRKLSKHTATSWFEDAQELFGWNSRYWEQRALLELDFDRIPRALDFAKVAVEKYAHSFTWTTLAKMLMEDALYSLPTDQGRARTSYDTAIAHLERAIESDRGTEGHEFSVLLNYTTKLRQATRGRIPGFDNQLESNFKKWIAKADTSPNQYVYENLGNWRYNWMMAISSAD